MLAKKERKKWENISWQRTVFVRIDACDVINIFHILLQSFRLVEFENASLLAQYGTKFCLFGFVPFSKFAPFFSSFIITPFILFLYFCELKIMWMKASNFIMLYFWWKLHFSPILYLMTFAFLVIDTRMAFGDPFNEIENIFPLFFLLHLNARGKFQSSGLNYICKLSPKKYKLN